MPDLRRTLHDHDYGQSTAHSSPEAQTVPDSNPERNQARKPARAQTYKDKERELADDIQARTKMLKEKYGEYTEE